VIIAKFVAVVVIGYLLGSIPFGMLVAKRTIKGDVRQYGSGKTGATLSLIHISEPTRPY